TLSLVSHQLRGPLSVIKLASDVLLAVPPGAPMDAKARRRLESVRRSVEDITTVLDNLLDLSGLERGALVLDLRPCSVTALLDTACAELQPTAQSRGVTLLKEAAPEPLEIVCDGERVTRVLTSLLSRALVRTPSGGTVRATAERQLSSDSRSGSLWLRVETDVPDSAADRGVERTRHDLALAVARGIVRAHGGQCDELGSAGSVGFTLPLS
ncbi:MAG TPA: HAMP domain-containing sensor histidine kinase, partial [Polyangiales bacterium]|nr:HAMP domain-containing sensor histidine kinase [Polyangiales bacterium]